MCQTRSVLITNHCLSHLLELYWYISAYENWKKLVHWKPSILKNQIFVLLMSNPKCRGQIFLSLVVCCKPKVLERSGEALHIHMSVWEEILQNKTLIQLYKMLVYMFMGSRASIHLWICLCFGGTEGRGCGIWQS